MTYKAEELSEVVVAIARYKKNRNVSPTVSKLAEILNCSRGSVEHKLKRLQEMGLLTRAAGGRIFLKGEQYSPPSWTLAATHYIKKRWFQNAAL